MTIFNGLTMNFSHFLFMIAALSTSLITQAGNSNYVEYGFGAAQLHSLDSEQNKGLSDTSFGGSAKLLIAGRLTRSFNTWFELSATHATGFEDSTTKTKTSSNILSAGLKFTTDPRQKFSSFMRLGGGKVFSNVKSNGDTEAEANVSSDVNDRQFYVGTGVSFRLDTKQAINLELQRYGHGKKDKDIGINTFFISFNQFI